ncbi:MAG: hypothetical protein K0B81_08565 [Candidatus Cloacimonetes bacterium]|nr:hypothetical protein [Candidatus Cloacimonadota bacterium]
MRTLIIIICLTLIATALFSQEINSFRNLSTGRALLDNLDFILDPLDIRYVSGIRLYTNLSNLSAEDRIFMNDGSNHFLMAISTDEIFYEGFRAAFMATYYDNKHPRPIQFYPNPYGEWLEVGFGEVEHIWQEFRDTNLNGLYDTHHIVQQSFENSEYHSGNEFYLNLSYQINEEHAVGFKTGLFTTKSGYNYLSNNMLGYSSGTPTFDYLEQIFNLPENDPTQEELELEIARNGEFETELRDVRWMNHFAYSFQPDDIEYRVGLVLATIHENEFTEDEIYLSPTQENALYCYEKEVAGLFIAFNGGARYTFRQMPERRHDGFISAHAQIGFHILDNETFQEMAYERDTIDEVFDISESFGWSDTMSEKGDIRSTDFLTSIRFSYPLNDRTFFGTGLRYHYTDFDIENDFHQAYESSETAYFIPMDEWLYTTDTESAIRGKSQHQRRINLFSIPVGLEYWFTNNRQWALRFGSQFTQRVETFNTLYQPTHVEPEITHVYLPDEDDPIIYIEDNTYEIGSESRKMRSSQTIYSYGVCFIPSRNLQIDLMGLFDQDDIEVWNTDFIRNLRISFSLRF